MRETLNDYKGLFNCLRLDEPIDLYPDDSPEVAECSFCINRATRSVEFKEKGERKHVYTCDDCHTIEDWTGKEIILITKL